MKLIETNKISTRFGLHSIHLKERTNVLGGQQLSRLMVDRSGVVPSVERAVSRVVAQPMCFYEPGGRRAALTQESSNLAAGGLPHVHRSTKAARLTHPGLARMTN